MTATLSIRRLLGPIGLDSLHCVPHEQARIDSLVHAVLDDFPSLVVSGRTVFIKPNLNYCPGHVRAHVFTDPRLLRALSAALLTRGAARVLIGEKPGHGRTSSESFTLLTQVGLPPGVELVPLGEAERRRIPTRARLLAEAVELPQDYLDADCVIDVAKMKTHTLTGVSLGMKNLFGLLTDAEKMQHHNDDIHLKLVDLLSVRRPDLTLIDGLIASEGQGPLFGDAVPLGLVVASDDCVAADAAAATVMGFAPAEIEHVRLAAREGLGESDLSRLRVTALSPADVRAVFRRGALTMTRLDGIEVRCGQSVPLGYLNAVSHSLERLAAGRCRYRPATVYVGTFPVLRSEEDAVVFGDVTAACRGVKAGRVIAGHPPRAFALYDLLRIPPD